MEIRFLIFATAACLACEGIVGEILEKVQHWKELDFQFTSDSARDRFIRNREFIPGNAVPIDVDTWQNGDDHRIFMTIPKFKDGIPASLVTISDRGSSIRSPPLKPYPDWSWHIHGNCFGLTSVFRTQIDKCGRLWAIDSGMVDLFKSPRRRLCQPQLLAFDLATNKESQRYIFPNSVLTEGSILANVAIDIRDGSRNQCSETFAYVADVTGFSIIVYDVLRNNSWTVQSNTMYPYPPQGVFRTNNVEFDLMDGILGLALGNSQNGKRMLYYHSFASVRESWVPTSVLKNQTIYSTGFNTAPREFKASEEARPSQTAPQAFDRHGILYFAPVAQNAIYCWNSQNTFKAQNLHELVRDDENLQFVTGLKIIRPNNLDEEELWVLATRFHLVMVDQMRRSEVNFRILKAKLSDLTRNSPCRQNRPIEFPQYTQRPGNEYPHGHGFGHEHGFGSGFGNGRNKTRRPGYGRI